jgi:hypothetical protein
MGFPEKGANAIRWRRRLVRVPTVQVPSTAPDTFPVPAEAPSPVPVQRCQAVKTVRGCAMLGQRAGTPPQVKQEDASRVVMNSASPISALRAVNRPPSYPRDSSGTWGQNTAIVQSINQILIHFRATLSRASKLAAALTGC